MNLLTKILHFFEFHNWTYVDTIGGGDFYFESIWLCKNRKKLKYKWEPFYD